MPNTSIYLVCFHSERRGLEDCSGQYEVVEGAIERDEWPYDNGDDPSFYVARKHGGRLTWGVCRQDLRNAIQQGSMVVFFSFTADGTSVLYRLCGVATVEEKLDHRAVYGDARLRGKPYINVLIRPKGNGWCYDESDRPDEAQHDDWLWRISNHHKIKKAKFNDRHRDIYRDRWFSEQIMVSEGGVLGGNYVLFSDAPAQTYISRRPPIVAVAKRGEPEKWSDRLLKRLSVFTAARYGARDYLRTANGNRPHRQIHFKMPADKAVQWRRELITALRQQSAKAPHKLRVFRGKARSTKCG